MSKHASHSVIHLDKNELLELRNARGTLIQCHRGTLWITQEHDSGDVVLKAGDMFEIRRQGLTLVTSFDNAALSVVRPGEPAFLSLRAAPYIV